MGIAKTFTTAAFIVAACVTFGADQSSAATCSTSNLTVSIDVECNPPTNPGGNVREAQMNQIPGVFGKTDWIELDRIESFSGTGSPEFGGNNLFSFSSDTAGDTSSGTWSLGPLLEFDPNEHYAIALKGGSASAVYLMSTAVTGGTWNDDGLAGGLSNVTLFGTGDLNVVPLPAAGWMLISGLAGLGFLGRRKAKA